jgi:hypothetical protein
LIIVGFHHKKGHQVVWFDIFFEWIIYWN